MLDELQVRNIALIAHADLEFSQGLTVLTGETGAGKTALLSALRLISGQRADSKMVRDGADVASASARYICEGEEHIVNRKLNSQGRSRCALDGEMATVGQLSKALEFVHIHNQHEQVLLLQPATQLEFLDRYISEDSSHLESYRQALACWRAAWKRCKELEEISQNREQELEYLQFVDSQISQVKPVLGEYERLEEELPRLQNAESLASAVNAALSSTYRDGAALDLLADAANALSRQTGVDKELDDMAARIDSIQADLTDVVRDLRSYAGDINYDPAAVQEHLSRLNSLSGLMKRYGPSMEQVLSTWEKARAAIEGSQSSPQALQQAKMECTKAFEEMKSAASSLQALRKAGAVELCEKLAKSVSELAMPEAAFQFEFTTLDCGRWTDSGPVTAELMYQPNPGVKPRPMRQIASGGELSRILLALECVLRSKDDALNNDTLVFDEVDSGVGGATGEAVGKRLAQLSQHAQVIAVTHLPQIAAQADTHFVVSKSVDDQGVAATQVLPVAGEERVREIARMLAGRDDETALTHARSLLAEAGRL